MAADIYQTLIDQLQADPDFPKGAVCTALPANAAINVHYEKTADIDQWQAAIPISTSVDDALVIITEQHQRAINRVKAAQFRAARETAQQQAQAVFHQQMKGLTDSFNQQRQAKRVAIKARHAEKQP